MRWLELTENIGEIGREGLGESDGRKGGEMVRWVELIENIGGIGRDGGRA